jgi:hypothetical protein
MTCGHPSCFCTVAVSSNREIIESYSFFGLSVGLDATTGLELSAGLGVSSFFSAVDAGLFFLWSVT